MTAMMGAANHWTAAMRFWSSHKILRGSQPSILIWMDALQTGRWCLVGCFEAPTAEQIWRVVITDTLQWGKGALEMRQWSSDRFHGTHRHNEGAHIGICSMKMCCLMFIAQEAVHNIFTILNIPSAEKVILIPPFFIEEVPQDFTGDFLLLSSLHLPSIRIYILFYPAIYPSGIYLPLYCC